MSSRSHLQGHRPKVVAVVLLASLLGLASPGAAYQKPGRTERVSVGSDGREGRPSPANVDPYRSRVHAPHSISATGRHVAFASHLSGLVPPSEGRNQLLGFSDIFVRDRVAGRTEIVSVNSRGELADYGVPCVQVNLNINNGICDKEGSWEPSISATGRYVAFTSHATNLVDDDTNDVTDVFVRDRKAHWTRRVSISSSGEQMPPHDGTGQSGAGTPAISPNGRYVAFVSASPNLVDGDTNHNCDGGPSSGGLECQGIDVFVHDLKTSKTERVSVSTGGAQSSGPSSCPSISATGRFVGFVSLSDDLVEGDANQRPDYFVHDRQKNITERVSVRSDGQEAAGLESFIDSFWGCGSSSLSADGRYVTFTHDGANLVPNDVVREPACYGFADLDAFVHDRKTGRTERVSVTSSGQEVEQIARAVSISADGRYVGFNSSSNDLDPRDGGELQCNVAPTLEQGDFDAFVFDRKTGRTEMVSVDSEGREADMSCAPPFLALPSPIGDSIAVLDPLGNRTVGASLSHDGRYVAYSACASNLVDDDTNGMADVFVHDRGPSLGVGDLGRPGAPTPPDDRICITDDICIPPGAALASSDATDDLGEILTQQGANLYGASLAHRPEYSDLFAVIELKHMPKVIPGASPISYGLRFKSGDKSYEVRAASLDYGTFGLFDCTGSPTCTKVADLRGGYGTTGMRVVFSLPLDEIGLEDSGKLRDVEAFSGLGSYLTGATKVLDQVRIR